MNHMFYYMELLTNLNLSNFDTSNVTNTSFMFYSDALLTTIVYGPNFGCEFDNDEDMYYDCPANGPEQCQGSSSGSV